eukprot:440087-Pelagomonas_calceolata.AAC.1
MVDRGTLDVLVSFSDWQGCGVTDKCFRDDYMLGALHRPPNYDRPLPEEVYILGTAHVSRQTAGVLFRNNNK